MPFTTVVLSTPGAEEYVDTKSRVCVNVVSMCVYVRTERADVRTERADVRVRADVCVCVPMCARACRCVCVCACACVHTFLKCTHHPLPGSRLHHDQSTALLPLVL